MPLKVTVDEEGSGTYTLRPDGSIDANTIGFFEKCLLAAIEQRASDVHFERHEEKVTIRFRVDGDLRSRRRTVTAARIHVTGGSGFIGGRLVERTVDHGPLALRELGADERRDGHHLHQREMGDEQHRAGALGRQAVFGARHAVVDLDAVTQLRVGEHR